MRANSPRPGDGAAVRRDLHRRYQRLLLDEFQDTDPIQIELAVRIAAADPASEAAGDAGWADVPVRPGHLFVVGDPKQSIYRFRRADISTFLKARDRFGPEGGGVVALTANFRTAAPVIDWVNHVFGALLSETPETELPLPSQPAYVGLDPTRPQPPVGPPIAVIGREAQAAKTKADDLRSIEAGDVARAVVTALTEGWSVDDGNGGWRAPRLGDVTILVPARTSLPFLEDALDDVGIPYRAESSSLVYATRAVRDLLMTLRAVADPTDHLAIVSALRSPLFGCGDDDLFRFKVERAGRWSYLAAQPETVPADDPVGAALRWFADVHAERHWRSPSQLLDRIATDRRALELGFAEGRPRDVWRRIRWVVDQARAWSETTGGGLRDYLHWVAQQTAEGARVVEAVLPETDDDAVRIMTIHAAKGLEFPITIVSGMTSRPQSRRASADVAFPPDGTVGYAFGARVVTPEFAAWAPIDEQMDFHERIRLRYVATTRARDHLVVSLHRLPRSERPHPNRRTNAELLVDGMGERLGEVPDVAAPTAGATVPAPLVPDAPPPVEAWAAERDRALRDASRPTTVAATALSDEGTPDVDDDPTAGLRKRPRDLDLPPWLKGRYGSAVGRAVHGVLQTIPLATGEGIEAAVAAQCEAEAIPERAADVHRLVTDALGSPVVRQAAASPHWRELYVCVPEGDRLLEGYLDLVHRGPDGLVVADYKTAATTDTEELDRRVGLYRLQGAAYALALAAATGEDVTRVVFLFLTPGGAVERELVDLDAAVGEVRDALRSHRAVALG
jgi:ATP-dependent exoDNAse (exonuclease V) beta subunit